MTITINLAILRFCTFIYFYVFVQFEIVQSCKDFILDIFLKISKCPKSIYWVQNISSKLHVFSFLIVETDYLAKKRGVIF